MPPPFQDLDAEADPPDFARLLARFAFERAVTEVHLHHTWRPRAEEWRGHETLQTIWYTHSRQLGWSDIAQHLSVAPDGHLWTGRDWNRPPCSAAGANGTPERGPFMIALVGDFNQGGDPWKGPQLQRTVDTIARLHLRFAIADDSLRFHRDLEPGQGVTCPGDTIDRAALVAAVTARRAELAAATAQPRSPFAAGPPPFSEETEAWYQFITICNENRQRLVDEPPGVPRNVAELALGGGDSDVGAAVVRPS